MQNTNNSGSTTPVLDHGFVRLVDTMGDEAAIVEMARTSYQNGTTVTRSDTDLIRYLMFNRHCYRGDMQVLTASGWKRWDECSPEEIYLVPDPATRTLKMERLALEVFDCDEPICTFENSRMSYAVTSDHRMWFKEQCGENFEVVRAGKMGYWGHFDPMLGYKYAELEGELDPKSQLIGFYLGDGSYASRNRINFHLKKERKKHYLEELLARLEIAYEKKESANAGAHVYWMEIPQFICDLTNIGARASEKTYLGEISELSPSQIRGLRDGLINSDGSIKKDRKQIQFSSSSEPLLSLFETLSALVGEDAHRTMTGATAYPEGGRTTLESRAQHHGEAHYKGKVYCTTTSTGMLVVRGRDDKFGFICGNTSPLEACEVKFHIKLPIFVMRQLVRHRSASLNEISGRYSELPNEVYIPDAEQICRQSKSNKQGRSEALDEADAGYFQNEFQQAADRCYTTYGEAIYGFDMARETARIALPLNLYTECYWKIDLHNFLHFLHLRLDHHAQWEIRQYAQTMADVLKSWMPNVYQAFLDFRRNAVLMSDGMIKALCQILTPENQSQVMAAAASLSRSERQSLEAMMGRESSEAT